MPDPAPTGQTVTRGAWGRADGTVGAVLSPQGRGDLAGEGHAVGLVKVL